MTRNNVFVGDRRVLQRYIGDELIFDNLANKTEVLSGEEIFTDKADDNAVVHVEVDGKSYQEHEPSPDSPIEIHSLNDFDVVSSVGRENLALNSNKGWMSSVYKVMDGTLSEDWVVGDTYTITIKGEVNAGNVFGIWRDAGGVRMPGSFVYNPETKTHSLTAVAPMPAVHAKIHNVFSIYNVLYANATSANIEWIKIEKGSFSTPYSLAPEDITESDNHSLIDKINLLLDEPLRSVGDVKDRLFRDTDGLWKVERNVGEIILDGSRSYLIVVNNNPEYSSYYFSDNDIAIMAKITSSHYPFFNHSGSYTSRESQQIRNYADPSASIMITDYTMTEAQFQNKLRDSPVTVVYEKRSSGIEALSQELQDKLNNLRTFKDSNYVYTVLPDKSNILQENLKPTLHTTFKSKGWEDFRRKTKEE